MTIDQTILFFLLLLVFVFLIWGRWRYDLVAFAALTIAVLTGVVPLDRAYSGFGLIPLRKILAKNLRDPYREAPTPRTEAF